MSTPSPRRQPTRSPHSASPEDFFRQSRGASLAAKDHASGHNEVHNKYKGHLEAHAKLIAQRAVFMSRVLLEHDVEPNAAIVKFPLETSKRREIHMNGLLFRRGQHKVKQLEPELITTGWEVSASATRFNVPRKIILLGSGALKLTQDAQRPEGGHDHGAYVTPVDDIDLTRYPFTDSFKQTGGYAPHVLAQSELVALKLIPNGTEYEEVADNLERIQDDMHTSYQALLGK